MTYQIVTLRHGYMVAEAGADGHLRPLNERPIWSREAAERLRDDLQQGRCPFPLTSPTGAHDPGEHVARCYDLASRIVPLLPKSRGAWAIALRLADAEPWHGRPACRHDDSDQIPF